MFIFTALIVVSAVLWLYYKVAILKTRDELTQKYFNGKARLFLGLLIVSFSINAYLLYQTKIALFIGIALAFFGVLQLTRGYGESKHYKKEYRRIHPEEA